ncbi:MAG: putative soluble pyridine nucleotide transhydrogenase [Myxococcota bacterium]|nr:putative soluble pyridine nucleotide transhydrogenase [Myxococcota bacterium]
MSHYDLIVIGSGPAGEKGAAQAAYFGKRVAIIEAQARPGGACVNTGTIPSKTLRESSLYLSGVRSRGLFGVNYLIKRDISVQDFMYRKHYVVGREIERINRNIDRHRIDLIEGWAQFAGPREILVDGPKGRQRLTADIFLIATGSTPHHPAGFPFDLPGVYDSDTILDIKDLPRSMAIIGAGVIGCEYATIFAALGARVILVDGREQMLPFLDRELSQKLHEQMMRLGIQVLFRESVTGVERMDGVLRVRLKSGDDFDVAAVLNTSGRNGNIAKLALDKAGVQTGERGRVVVNDHFQTSVPHIYAAGDVVGFPALASVSMEQGRVAMCHAFGIKYKDRVSNLLPMGVYTIPEVSAVGETEESCQEKGIPHEVGRAGYAGNARGQIIGDEDGFVKLVFHRENLRLLGVHVIGEKASELVHIGQAVMSFNGQIDYFIQTVFNYPTLSELYKYAAYDGLGRLSRRVQMEGVNALKKDAAE